MKKASLALIPLLLIGALVAFSSLKQANLAPEASLAVEASTSLAADPDFIDFLKQFPKAGLPYHLSAEHLKDYLTAAIQLEEKSDNAEQEALYNSRVRLHDPRRFLPASRHSSFSRIPVFLEPVARMETKSHYAVVYSESQGFGWAYKSYHVAVFNKSGHLLSEHIVAGTGSTELTAVAIDAQLRAVVQTYRINWKNDYYQNGTEGNEITGLTLDTAETLDLTQVDKELREYKPIDKEDTDTGEEDAIGALGR